MYKVNAELRARWRGHRLRTWLEQYLHVHLQGAAVTHVAGRHMHSYKRVKGRSHPVGLHTVDKGHMHTVDAQL